MIDIQNTQAPLDIIHMTGGKRIRQVPLNQDGILLSRRNASTPYYGVRQVPTSSSGYAIQFSSSVDPSDWFWVSAPEGLSEEALGEISTTITLSELRADLTLYDLLHTPMIIETSYGDFAIKDGNLRRYNSHFFDLENDMTHWIILNHDEEVESARLINRRRPIETNVTA